MECPKCGHVQADGPPECGKCGLIFARWVERRSSATLRPRPSPRPGPSPDEPEGAKVSPLGLLLGCTGVLFLGLATWHVWSGGGLPVDREAYRDDAAGFAIVLPYGWSLLTPGNAAAVLEKSRGRYPEAVEQAFHDARTVAAMFYPEEPGDTAPWAIVTAVEGIPPPLVGKDGATLATVAGAALSARFEGYRLREGTVERVDRLPALRVSGGDTVHFLKSPSQEIFGELPGGGRYPIGRTVDVWDDFDRSLDHWLIPGGNRSFVLAFGGPETSRALNAKTVERIVDSFRVLNRPPRYGQAMTPALRAAATVLLAAVLLYTLTEAAALLRRR